MQSNWRWATAAVLAVASGGAAADSLDLSLNDKALRGIYAFSPAGKRGLEVEAGHYYTEHTAENTTVTHAGLQVSGENWSQQGVFDIGLGARAIYARSGSWDETSLAFGGHVRFSPIQRLGITGILFYGPEVTTSGDGNNYLETEAKVDYQLLPQAFVYAGYRVIQVDVDGADDDAKLDDRVHIGMKLMF
jgi:hypothetical protein